MWQTKYASAVPKNLGLGSNFWPCSEGNFFSGRLTTVSMYVCVGSRFAGWLRGELKSLPISLHYTETSPRITQFYYEIGNKDHFPIYSGFFHQWITKELQIALKTHIAALMGRFICNQF